MFDLDSFEFVEGTADLAVELSGGVPIEAKLISDLRLWFGPNNAEAGGLLTNHLMWWDLVNLTL